MKKYFKIGEISRLYHIGVDSLRYYEEIGVIKPFRAESGYRLYSVDDIWRLNVIRDLRELGFGMERIKAYLDTHTVSSTLELLEEEQKAIEEKQKILEKLQENVVQRMESIRSAEERCMDEITVQNYPPRACFSITEGYSDEHEMDVLIKRLLNLDPENLYVIGNNQIGTVVSRKDTEAGILTYDSVFVIDENGTDMIEGGSYLSVSYRGDYTRSGDWAGRLLRYAHEQGWRPIGDFLEILWVDIHTTSAVDEHITELQIRVEPLHAPKKQAP